MLRDDSRCLFSCKGDLKIFGDMEWIGVVLQWVLTDVSATRCTFEDKAWA